MFLAVKLKVLKWILALLPGLVFEDGSHFAALVQGRIATAWLRRQVAVDVQYIAVMSSTVFRFAYYCRRKCVRSCGSRVGRRNSILCAGGVCHRAKIVLTEHLVKALLHCSRCFTVKDELCYENKNTLVKRSFVRKWKMNIKWSGRKPLLTCRPFRTMKMYEKKWPYSWIYSTYVIHVIPIRTISET